VSRREDDPEDPIPNEDAPTAGRRLVTVQVGKFALAGVVALVIVGLATSIASRRIGEREAIFDARTTTLIKAQAAVEPALADGVVDGDAQALARLSQVIRSVVLDVSLVRVKIWTPDGKIVYSDEPRLVGATYALGPDERDVLLSDKIEAEISDLTKPENRFERSYGKLLEVYLPVHTPSGRPLLFEAYYRYSTVAGYGDRLWRAFAPIALGALVMLELVQLPLAWSLARRLRLRLRERERLVSRALHASDIERRQIASDLHDGAIQDLAGVAYALSAADRSTLTKPLDAGVAEESAHTIRGSIQELRSLIVNIYPPNFAESSFEGALAELLTRAEGRGLAVRLDVKDVQDPITPPVARLFYRSAQEGIRNVLRHANASSVSLSVSTAGGRAILEVIDDGKGLGPNGTSTPFESVGLTALEGLVNDSGGTLEIRPTTPSGVTLHVEVPL
jgi:two-component system, NarL family, sensor kinase